METIVYEGVIIATWQELSEMGVTCFLKGDRVKVWDIGTYFSKVAFEYDLMKGFHYVPTKFLKLWLTFL